MDTKSNAAMTTPQHDDRQAAKQTLVNRLNTTRNVLLTLLRNLPPERREVPGACGDWSVKDVVGHLASWEDRLLTLAQMLINHEDHKIEWIADEEALQAWNHKEYLRKRDWTWDETLRDLALIREELLWNLGWATPQQLFEEHASQGATVSAASLIEGVVEHDHEHIALLEAWLEPNSAR